MFDTFVCLILDKTDNNWVLIVIIMVQISKSRHCHPKAFFHEKVHLMGISNFTLFNFNTYPWIHNKFKTRAINRKLESYLQ